MKFKLLVKAILDTQQHLQQKALQSVNQWLSIRNWLFGYYIVEYQQKGEDRAKYGDQVIRRLSSELKTKGVKGMSFTNLNLYRQFYHEYPQIVQTVSEQLKSTDFSLPKDFLLPKPSRSKNIRTASEQLQRKKFENTFDSKILLRHFSFSHFIELIKIDNPGKRTFYEIEAIKGNWSVRQIQRQIGSLLYERTGLSKNKTSVLAKAQLQQGKINIEDAIRDPYILEFTGLKELAEFSESVLETALLNHIQDFLLELGDGFCFEARQKRVSIDNEHDRIDLVFYHRVLRCHVLIDLKIRKFSHGDAGQMNFYLNYFKDNIKAEQDNPPIGIILCTDKSETKVKYATAGLANKLFVSKYLVTLPSEKQLEEFIRQDRERIESTMAV